MVSTYFSTVAAFFGSATGGLAVVAAKWRRERRKHHMRHTAKSHSGRRKLYRQFIEEASRLYADALVSDGAEISQLVNLYSLVGRMRLVSGEAVIEAAEKAGLLILETYLSPNRTFLDLPALLKEMDPLSDFAEACRRELQEAAQY
jgi:hypothetical protein